MHGPINVKYSDYLPFDTENKGIRFRPQENSLRGKKGHVNNHNRVNVPTPLSP
jgi:hypothetical protein